ncbi:MAG: hypothetical protein N4A70_20085 [Pelagimonas sp.]|nr:hypothetical protein [Pelagimonas sp.]
MLMISSVAQRRIFSSEPEGDDATRLLAVDTQVLGNTVEQVVLAICIWPLAGYVLGTGVLVALGLSFAVMRLVFWFGSHRSKSLQAFGFAAGFYPTVFAAIMTLFYTIYAMV